MGDGIRGFRFCVYVRSYGSVLWYTGQQIPFRFFSPSSDCSRRQRRIGNAYFGMRYIRKANEVVVGIKNDESLDVVAEYEIVLRCRTRATDISLN